MATKTKKPEGAVEIKPLSQQRITIHVVGTSPLIFNSMSGKAIRDLLLPPRKKSRTARETTLKHDPLQEYRQSVNCDPSSTSPTLLVIPATAFKGALRTAALDTDGATKSSIGRLVTIQGTSHRDWISIYGTPQLHMAVVRMADMARTPDIRTRAILPQWAGVFHLAYVQPNLTQQSIFNLLHTAGITAGVGDGRPEKGALSFGQFRVVTPDDAEFQLLTAEGRDVQVGALQAPTAYDAATADLLDWVTAEAATRELTVSR